MTTLNEICEVQADKGHLVQTSHGLQLPCPISMRGVVCQVADCTRRSDSLKLSLQ